MRTMIQPLALLVLLAGMTGCGETEVAQQPPKLPLKELVVTATAYTSNVAETDDTPNLAAWNNELKPGMKAIAVSRDLIPMGLTNGKEVMIEGLEGRFKVLDKMHKRWEKKIDIYMGLNHKRAKEWGKKTVKIRWHDAPLE